MKVHITLVGGQTAPVYHTIAALRPDYIVYIYSENTQKELSRLKGEISIDSEEIKFHPTDIQKIKSETEKLHFNGKMVNTLASNPEITIMYGLIFQIWSGL